MSLMFFIKVKQSYSIPNCIITKALEIPSYEGFIGLAGFMPAARRMFRQEFKCPKHIIDLLIEQEPLFKDAIISEEETYYNLVIIRVIQRSGFLNIPKNIELNSIQTINCYVDDFRKNKEILVLGSPQENEVYKKEV